MVLLCIKKVNIMSDKFVRRATKSELSLLVVCFIKIMLFPSISRLIDSYCRSSDL